MKKFVMILTSVLMMSTMAVGQNTETGTSKLIRLTQEMSDLENKLKTIKNERSSDIMKVFVSEGAAVLIGIAAKKVYDTNVGGDMMVLVPQMAGLGMGVVAVGAASYGAIKGYSVSLKTKEIDSLISLIGSKRLELDAAKRVSEALEAAAQ